MTGAIDIPQLASPLLAVALIPITQLGDPDGHYAAARSSLYLRLMYR